MNSIFILAPFIIIIIMIALMQSLRIFNESQRGVLFRIGRFKKIVGPRLIFILPNLDKLLKINLNEIFFGGLLLSMLTIPAYTKAADFTDYKFPTETKIPRIEDSAPPDSNSCEFTITTIEIAVLYEIGKFDPKVGVARDEIAKVIQARFSSIKTDEFKTYFANALRSLIAKKFIALVASNYIVTRDGISCLHESQPEI